MPYSRRTPRAPSDSTAGSAASQAPQPEAEGIGFLVRHAHRAFARVLAEHLAPHGISAAQWTVLRALWREDRCSQVELAARIRVEKASLTQVLASLERQGLIERERSEADKRRWHVCLTQAGRALEPELLPFARSVDKAALTGFTADEVAALKQLLTRALRNLE